MNDMDLQVRWDGIERRRRCVDGPFRTRFQVAAELCPEIVEVLRAINRRASAEPLRTFDHAIRDLDLITDLARALLNKMRAP